MAEAAKVRTLTEIADLRWNNRVERFKRLLDLNAPDEFLYSELILLKEALWLRDPEGCSRAERRSIVARLKRQVGYCHSDECDQPALPDEQGGYGYCGKCTAEIEREQAEIEDGPIEDPPARPGLKLKRT